MPSPTKLTLRLDSALIDRAKTYALEQDRSLSQLVADYFTHLAPDATTAGMARKRRAAARKPPGPITAGLRGVLRLAAKGVGANKAPAGRDDYRAYLEKKYL